MHSLSVYRLLIVVHLFFPAISALFIALSPDTVPAGTTAFLQWTSSTSDPATFNIQLVSQSDALKAPQTLAPVNTGGQTSGKSPISFDNVVPGNYIIESFAPDSKGGNGTPLGATNGFTIVAAAAPVKDSAETTSTSTSSSTTATQTHSSSTAAANEKTDIKVERPSATVKALSKETATSASSLTSTATPSPSKPAQGVAQNSPSDVPDPIGFTATGQSPDPSAPSDPTATGIVSSGASSQHRNIGVVIGGILAGCLTLLAIVVSVVICIRRRRMRRRRGTRTFFRDRMVRSHSPIGSVHSSAFGSMPYQEQFHDDGDMEKRPLSYR
ncbi:hypothetical protein C8J56DRAFT_1159856 [Mycena floridula]|nr:hypothetical protein C8J56DRAFT_1159856 [Mycena floridula]